jgi:hypothetical protein
MSPKKPNPPDEGGTASSPERGHASGVAHSRDKAFPEYDMNEGLVSVADGSHWSVRLKCCR